MAYVVKKNLVSTDRYSIKCPYQMEPQFVVVHNTANDASAENEVAYMIRNNNQVSFHYAVDDKEVVQGLPITRNAWACGDGSSGNGNRKGIQVEICYSKSGGIRFENAEKNAAQFIASLLKERGWSVDKVKKHQDFSKKYCPHRTLDKGWVSFVNMVKNFMSGNSYEESSVRVGERVRVKESAKQYATGEEMAWFVKGAIYEVNQVAGNKVLLSDIMSWVWLDDVALVNAPSKACLQVEIICDSLNIREKADFNSKIVGTVKRGEVFTIVAEQNGLGKLKSGVGYISMNPKYIKKRA
ncbi:N-acetylmuramoyl-L-alanine amidase [Turicibacter sp. TS3]|uniref:N-acetylmuramoyl-L-alanine amidase n=1 Tax=Turicibacter sp. TS3 TaxID=2304578 RepID=UPI00137B3764|nr:N-acetylmuramoyl-L-alanine amidase [Turicibacter sp. TS3]NCE79370.1 N-acetylmuramoyl-L-alanine amidase [Turicibacter sp. TS3]